MHLFLLFPSCCFVVFIFRLQLLMFGTLLDAWWWPIHISSSWFTSGEALCYGLFDLRRSVFSNCCFVKLKDSITTIRPHDTQFLYFSVFHISLRAIVSFVVMLWMLMLIILCWLLIFQWVNLLQTRVIMLLCV